MTDKSITQETTLKSSALNVAPPPLVIGAGAALQDSHQGLAVSAPSYLPQMRQELAQHGIDCQGFAEGEIIRRYQLLVASKVTGRCHNCGGNKFWETPDKRILCATCHPKPR